MKKLSTILIAVGLLVIAVPIAGQLYTSYNENKMIDEWLNSDDVQTAGNEGTAAAASGSEDAEESYKRLQDIFSSQGLSIPNTTNVQPTPSQAANPDTAAASAAMKPSNTPPAAKKQDKSASRKVTRTVIGVIKIDKIKVRAPIVEGVTAGDLRVGIGHIPGTAGLGAAGNCVLAGHRSYTFGKFFNRLDELKTGDSISIITKNGVYKYKVFEKLVVKPQNVSVLKGNKKDSIISLITCTPIYIASHRLVVKARLESKPVSQP